MSRSRSFCFTHNNYENTELEDNVECKYIIYGREVGESGTPHLQGFVSFETLKSLKQVIALLPGCHVEVAIAPDAAIEYCKKDGDFVERGSYTTRKQRGENEKLRWAEALECAKEGRLDDIQPELRIRYKRSFDEIAREYAATPADLDRELKNEWIYGPSGCGKSSTARKENPGAYIKDLTKWWDGYQNEEVVIIDDVDKYDVKIAGNLKRWSDHYPFQAEMKGKQQLIRPQKIIVTSQYHMHEIWEDERTQAALGRRFVMRPMMARYDETEYKGETEDTTKCFCGGLCSVCVTCKKKKTK